MLRSPASRSCRPSAGSSSRPWATASALRLTPTPCGATGNNHASTGTRVDTWHSSAVTARSVRYAPSSPTPACCRRSRGGDLAEEAVPVAHGAERLQVGVEPDQGAQQEYLVPRSPEETVLDGRSEERRVGKECRGGRAAVA